MLPLDQLYYTTADGDTSWGRDRKKLLFRFLMIKLYYVSIFSGRVQNYAKMGSLIAYCKAMNKKPSLAVNFIIDSSWIVGRRNPRGAKIVQCRPYPRVNHVPTHASHEHRPLRRRKRTESNFNKLLFSILRVDVLAIVLKWIFFEPDDFDHRTTSYNLLLHWLSLEVLLPESLRNDSTLGLWV